MVTENKTGVTLGDVFKQKGIVPRTFELNKRALADNEVTFCVTSIKRVEVTNPDINAKEQWNFDIEYQDDKGRTLYKIMPMSFSETRDETVKALIEMLETLPDGEKIVHGLMLEALPMKKYDNPYYNIVQSVEPCKHMQG